jgi:hypothetical protein
MNSHSKFDPAQIYDVAAHLFWLAVSREGVAATSAAVVSSNGMILLESPDSQRYLDSQFSGTSAGFPRAKFLDEMMSVAVRFCRDEQQLTGILYAEDAQSGRAPSAQGIDTSCLNMIPYRIDRTHAIESIGSLCIRWPLPAVVFSNKNPASGFIEVSDTRAALGFQTSLFLQVMACIPVVPEKLFALTGIFSVPVHSVEHGNRWKQVIPNFVGFMTEFGFITKSNLLRNAGPNISLRAHWLVSRGDVEREIDWLISIEPNPESIDSMDNYRKIMSRHSIGINKANELIRKYGEQLTPPTLSTLQDEFYSITNSRKYSRNAKSQIIARSALNNAWSGIHGWRN